MKMSNIIITDCGCNKEGSTNDACDQTSGQCTCKPGWTGNKCQSKLKLIICIQYKTLKMFILWVRKYEVYFCNVELDL